MIISIPSNYLKANQTGSCFIVVIHEYSYEQYHYSRKVNQDPFFFHMINSSNDLLNDHVPFRNLIKIKICKLAWHLGD